MIIAPLQVHLHSNPKKPDQGFAVRFPYSEDAVKQIHAVLGLLWDKNTKSWVSDGPEVLLDMERWGIKPVWLSGEARSIAENFRQQLWNVIEARAEPIYDSEYGYQQQGTKFLILNKRALLGDAPGLGKTKQTLDAIAEVGVQKGAYRRISPQSQTNGTGQEESGSGSISRNKRESPEETKRNLQIRGIEKANFRYNEGENPSTGNSRETSSISENSQEFTKSQFERSTNESVHNQDGEDTDTQRISERITNKNPGSQYRTQSSECIQGGFWESDSKNSNRIRQQECPQDWKPEKGSEEKSSSRSTWLESIPNKAFRILVMAPKTITYNWMKEIEKWYPEISAGVVPDVKSWGKQELDRKRFWKNPPQIVIANYEKLLADDWPYEMYWDIVICDEAQRLKNSNTSTWKSLKKIIKETEYVWLLTGTPLEIHLMELYNIFALIRPSVLGSYPRFREQHCMLDWGGNVVGVQNLELLRERIGYWMLRRTKAEVLPNLPPKIYNNRFVKMTVQEQKEYQEILSDFKSSLSLWQPHHGDPLTKTIRLRQYCSSPSILGYGRKGSKYEELVDIIKEWDGQVVVFGFFEEAMSMLQQWLIKDVGYNPRAYISGKVSANDGERIKRASEFDQGKLGKVFLSTDAGREGIDLVSADLVIHYDQGMWNPQKQHQREDRSHRIGQKNTLNVINLMYMDSIDYGMYLVNEEREQLFQDVVEGAEISMLKKINPARLLRLAEGNKRIDRESE